jgi:hypothetical protein
MPGFALQGAASHGWLGVLGNTHGPILHLPLNYHTGGRSGSRNPHATHGGSD